MRAVPSTSSRVFHVTFNGALSSGNDAYYGYSARPVLYLDSNVYIYDGTGTNILAVSSTVETVTVNPTNIANEDKEKVAIALSNIFELDYETVLKKLKKRSSIETIVKKEEKEKTDELRKWMEENNITSGINIDEDTKRYYPYNDLASQIIGFCGSDNQGLDGIEAKYEEELNVKQGAIQKHTDAKG